MHRAGMGVTLAGVAVVASSCAGLGGLGAAACPQLRPNVDALNARYSANAQVNAKVSAFVQASKDIVRVSAEAERVATEACLRMGRDLQIPPQQMAPDKTARGGARAKGACDAVARRIAQIQAQGFRVTARITPPRCQANVQAEARCKGSCTASVDPGYVAANCQPGRISGYCQGTCVGRCDGRCNGQCSGQCTARDAVGNCIGQCQGECRGRCDATCHANCQGQWQAPRCEAWVRPPSADADCEGSCRAHANVNASCTPALVQVQASQNTQAAMALVATLQANLPQLIHAQIALGQRLLADIDTVVRIGQQLPRVVGQAGVQALACIGAATDASVSASISVKVTVQASAGVSGRVGG